MRARAQMDDTLCPDNGLFRRVAWEVQSIQSVQSTEAKARKLAPERSSEASFVCVVRCFVSAARCPLLCFVFAPVGAAVQRHDVCNHAVRRYRASFNRGCDAGLSRPLRRACTRARLRRRRSPTDAAGLWRGSGGPRAQRTVRAVQSAFLRQRGCAALQKSGCADGWKVTKIPTFLDYRRHLEKYCVATQARRFATQCNTPPHAAA